MWGITLRYWLRPASLRECYLAIESAPDSDIWSGVWAAELDMVGLKQISANSRELEPAGEPPIESGIRR